MKSNRFKMLLACAAGTISLPLSVHAVGPNPDYAPGDLVMFFQEEGGTKTVYVRIGQTALDFRGAAAGADAPNKINIIDASDALEQAFGADWATKTNVYAGLAGVWGTSGSLSNALDNGDPNRTLYVSKARAGVGAVGTANSTGYSVGSDGSMSSAATDMFNMNNNPFETLYSGPIAVSPNSESSIDENNPFLSAGLQGTAFRTFAAGVQQVGQSGNFGSFGPVTNVEFMLDLYRILAKTGISGQVGGTLRQGSYEGTIVLDSNGMISFVTSAGASTNYDLWADQKALAGADRAGTADPDKDGIKNSIEFVIGGEPKSPTSGDLLPKVERSGGNMIVRFRQTEASAYLLPFVQHDTDLTGTWTNAVHGIGGVVVSTEEDYFDGTTARITVTIPSAGATNFARLAVPNED